VTSKNLKVIFDNKKMEVYSDRLLVTGIKQSNQCYKIFFKTVTNDQANVSMLNTIMLWHERMGHVNFRTLKEMADSGRLPGLQTKNLDGLFCEACQYGKLHRLPFQKNPKSRAQEPGEFIHMDLCDKMTHPSIGGANYFLLFKDCTSYRTAYFIKHKSDTFSKFVEYHKLVENQTGNKLRKVRSDKGKEFDNEQFKQYFKEKGIIHEYSAPYIAEQNGRIERENRLIVEVSGLCCLQPTFNLDYGQKLSTLVYMYTLNRRPRELDKNLPYELWSGKTVTLNHLRKFGAVVHVYVPKQFRSKFESKKMVLVGYDRDSSNYRVFDTNTSKIIVTRDVVFNENENKKNQEKESDVQPFRVKHVTFKKLLKLKKKTMYKRLRMQKETMLMSMTTQIIKIIKDECVEIEVHCVVLLALVKTIILHVQQLLQKIHNSTSKQCPVKILINGN